MNPGRLKHRIDIYAKIAKENEYRQTYYDYDILKTIWAEIIPQTGKMQTTTVDTILSKVTHKIICRYSAGNDITQDMHIKYRGHKFDIKYILNPYFGNKTLEIFCEEVIE